MNTMSIMTGFFAVNNFKTYGQANGLTNDDYLAVLGSIAAVCNSIRFLWSWATDYIPYKVVYAFLLCGQITLSFTIKLVAKSQVFYTIWIGLMLFCEGGHFTIIPNALKCLYGDRATEVYGIVFTYTGLSCLLIIFIVQAPFGQNYVQIFNLTAILSTISLFVLLGFFNERIDFARF